MNKNGFDSGIKVTEKSANDHSECSKNLNKEPQELENEKKKTINDENAFSLAALKWVYMENRFLKNEITNLKKDLGTLDENAEVSKKETKILKENAKTLTEKIKALEEKMGICSEDFENQDEGVLNLSSDSVEPNTNLRTRKRTTSTDRTVDVAKRKKSCKVVGLKNLGNTCFMNSVLHSLRNIHQFSSYFSELPPLETEAQQNNSMSLTEHMDDANVVEEFRKILKSLTDDGDGFEAVSPENLFLVIWKAVPQFQGYRQHDAHEFLRYMLDRLHTEFQHLKVPMDSVSGSKTKVLNAPNVTANGSTMFKRRRSIVTKVFGGKLRSEVRCLICGMKSQKHDPFLDLSLDIPEKFFKETDDNEKPICDIADCLSSFTDIEELSETELFYCGSCKCKRKCTKRFWIKELPKVLCLHLKRFQWNSFHRIKIDLSISFPLTAMDMSPFVVNNGQKKRRSNGDRNIYDLAAVIVHHGNGSDCGHYTSFALNNGNWLHFNDEIVKEVLPATVAECKPYILFYNRREENLT